MKVVRSGEGGIGGGWLSLEVGDLRHRKWPANVIVGCAREIWFTRCRVRVKILVLSTVVTLIPS